MNQKLWIAISTLLASAFPAEASLVQNKAYLNAAGILRVVHDSKVIYRVEALEGFREAPCPGTFHPQVLVQQEGPDMAIYVAPRNLGKPAGEAWLVYGYCLAIWEAEPQHRLDITGSASREKSPHEAGECLGVLHEILDRP